MKFVTDRRRRTSLAWAVHGITSDNHWEVSLFLDYWTGDVFYPVVIKAADIAGVSILLDGPQEASISLPQIVPAPLIAPVRDSLTAFVPVVKAAEAWIKEEIVHFQQET